jgi:hypothetical protein
MMRNHTFAPAAAAVLLLSAVALVRAQQPPSWEKLQFLLGTWVSTGSTELGSADGTASFTEDLGRHVLVRRSFADYKSGPQAGTHHDDLMVIYRETDDAPPRAIYFDSEGHVIRYTVTVKSDNRAVFESEPSAPGPRYRLSYARLGSALNGTFEIAAPGADYKTYLTWSSQKR